MFAVIGLTGFGSYLAGRQVRQIENSNREAALESGRELVIPAILKSYEQSEDKALNRLEDLAFEVLPERLERLTRLHEEQSEIASPFFYGSGGALLYPPPFLGVPTLPPLFPDIPPDDFQQAQKFLWGSQDASLIVDAFENLYRQEHLESKWRWRALSLLGGYYLKNQQEQKAVEAYRRLFENFEEEIQSTDPTSYLDLALVYSEALEKTGQKNLATKLLNQVLKNLLRSTNPQSDYAGEALFSKVLSHRLPQEMEKSPEAPTKSAEFRALFQRHKTRLQHFEVGNKIGSKIQEAILEAQEAEDRSSTQRVKFNQRGQSYLISWQASSSLLTQLNPQGIKGFGFVWSWQALEAKMKHVLEQKFHGFRFNLIPTQPLLSTPSEDDLPSLALPSPLNHLSLKVDGRTWRRKLKDQKRPLRFAQVLIPILGLGMLLALYLLHRSFARLNAISQLKTDFVANVSHELKTPLALIRMFGETLQLGRIREESKKLEYYEIITRESERLTHLINNVLDFASIEAGKKQYELQTTDLTRVVKETLKAYKFQLDQKGFEVSLQAPEAPLITQADPDAVSQAIINLINNAIKYSRDTKRLQVSVKQNGETIEIHVRDHGVGIPRKDQAKIFEGFFRSKQAISKGARGTGLGLALVNHIMESHSGRIELESQLGTGSTFSLIFPLVEEPQVGETERH